MPPDQDAQDLIKRVTEATVKAVAARDNVTVSFAPGAHGITQTEDGTQARLPTPVRVFGEGDLSVLRGEADAVALRLRYNDVKFDAFIFIRETLFYILLLQIFIEEH